MGLFALVKYFANIGGECAIRSGRSCLGCVLRNRADGAARGNPPHRKSPVCSFVLLIFVPLGALMGREFRKFKPLNAYSIDIGGSLLGIAAFAGLSAAGATPVMWFALGFGLWAILSVPRHEVFLDPERCDGCGLRFRHCGPLAPPPEVWSPYYRINVFRTDDNRSTVHVNGSMHQWILNLEDSVAGDDMSLRDGQSGLHAPVPVARPYRHRPCRGPPAPGNDLALLLEMGVDYIDAVEIDPAIQELGRQRHFQDPYADPRVHAHVNDARAFLRRTNQKYDLIVFGTLDSQTLLSGMTSLRLDNYVYTLESIQSARARLGPTTGH